jgi:predicted nucleic acid-binding protein
MKSIPVVVPDTSVLLKWVIESDEEEDRGHALELREAWLSGHCSIVLPSLWFFEVGNILEMKQSALAPQLMQILIDYGIEEERPGTIYKKTFELMNTYKVTFYDAAYHAVAIIRSGTMVTADDTYVRKTFKAGNVNRLSHWTLT